MSNYFYTITGNLEIIHTPSAAETPARLYPWHMHLRHWTAGHVACGAVRLTLHDAIRHYRADGLFLIPPKTPHQLVVEPRTDLTVLSYTDPAELARLASFLSMPGNGNIRLPAGDAPRALALAALSAHDAWPPAGQGRHAGIMEQAIHAIAARIAAKPQAEFSVERMAECAGFSQWHFLRCFQAHIGITPHAFQTQCRIRLLRVGIRLNTDLATLAVSTGFTDQSHMHRLFKRHHCLTPKEFRRASFMLSL
jgi:AraC-like DNA-binding protein